jgi:arylsulfatase A-like enzyme
MRPLIMRLTCLLLPLVGLFVVPIAAAEKAAEKDDSRAAGRKPNVLLIYTDDHGWADLGAQGADKDIRTPNMDQLARDGVRCVRGYVSAPQCVPSRAGVITGCYQERFGVEDNTKGPLPLSEVTIAQRLKAAGYVSGQVGKWHLDGGGKEEGEAKSKQETRADRNAGKPNSHLPNAFGFDDYWCGAMRQYHASHDLRGNLLPNPPSLVKDDRFRITVQTEAALRFLARRAAKPQQPWFLYLAWFAPHVPLESPEPWFSQTPRNLPIERRQALAMIAAMDDGLGRIRAKLREMGQDKNTLIFVIGDNGAPLKPKAWNGSLNLPMVGEKGMLTDGGVRTPFVVAWPGTLPAGKIYDWPVLSLDVAATAVALAGLPHDDKLDGVNLIPFLTGGNPAASHDYLYWRWRSQSSVLEYPWKLIHLGTNETYLFNVTRPEGELKNLIREHPDIAARLDAKLKTWCGALKPPGPAVPNNPQDNTFYAVHVNRTQDDSLYAPHGNKASYSTTQRSADAGKATAPGNAQGWIYRNGTLSVRDGALVLTPVGKAQGFLTCNNLSIPGPVTVALRVRAKKGGMSSITWRTKATPDFVPPNVAAFDWPTSAEWQDVKAELPVDGMLIHIRLNPGRDCTGLEVQSIELRGKDSKPHVWRFDSDVKRTAVDPSRDTPNDLKPAH